MKRRFRGFRGDRFALTTLQNPTWEVRTRAELIQAAQNERPIQQQAAQPPQTMPPPPAVPEVEPEVNSAPPLAPNPVPSPVPSPAPNLAFGRAINKLAEFLARADTLDAISAATNQKIAQKTEESSEG